MKRFLLLSLFFQAFSGLFAQITVTNERSINSAFQEYSPALYGKGLVFVAANPAIDKDKKEDTQIGRFTTSIFLAKRTPEGVLQRPLPFAEELTTRFYDGPMSFNAAGDVVFITRSNLKKGKPKAAKDGKVKLKIYSALLTNGTWTNITELPFCDGEADYAHPAVSADGRRLFFSSNRSGGQGGMDLYVSMNQNGTWGEPVNLGPKINTAKDEIFPFSHASGVLFFSSNGRQGVGGLDIFWTKQTGNGWLTPTDLPETINSPSDDFGLVLNTERTNGYFASNRASGLGDDDIYNVSIPDGLEIQSTSSASVEDDLFAPKPAKTAENSQNTEGSPSTQKSNAAAEKQRIEEQKREETRIAEQKKAEEQKQQAAKLAELKRIEAQKREETQMAEKKQLAEKKREEAEIAERKREEADLVEQRRMKSEIAEAKQKEAIAAEKRRAETRNADQKREDARLAEEKKKEAKLAELKREEDKIAEQKRVKIAAEMQKREDARLAEEKKEAIKLAEQRLKEAKFAEMKREEAKSAEQKREEAKLAEAKLAEQKREDARLAEAKIEEQKREETRLVKEQIEAQKREDARLADAKRAELRLAEAKIAEAKREEARFEEKKRSDAKIEEIRIAQNKIAEAKAAETRIAEAKREEARIEEKKRADAKIEEVKIAQARVAEARNAELKVAEAKIEEARIAEAKIREARNAELKIEETRIADAKIREARNAELKIEETRVAEAKIREARNAELKIAEARNAELKIEETRVAEAKIREAQNAELKIAEAKLAETKIEEARIAEAKIKEARIAEAKIAETRMAEVKMTEIRMAEARKAEEKLAAETSKKKKGKKRKNEPEIKDETVSFTEPTPAIKGETAIVQLPVSRDNSGQNRQNQSVFAPNQQPSVVAPIALQNLKNAQNGGQNNGQSTTSGNDFGESPATFEQTKTVQNGQFKQFESQNTEGSQYIETAIATFDKNSNTVVSQVKVGVIAMKSLKNAVVVTDLSGKLTGLRSEDGAEIALDELPQQTEMSNEKGRVKMPLVIGERYLFNFSKAGYEPKFILKTILVNDSRVAALLVPEKYNNAKPSVATANQSRKETPKVAENPVVYTENAPQMPQTRQSIETQRISYSDNSTPTQVVDNQNISYNTNQQVDTNITLADNFGDRGTDMSRTLTQGKTFELRNIYYGFGDAELNDATKTELTPLVAMMQQETDMEIEIAAHTDSRGKAPFNLNLSQLRADNIKSFLVERDIAPERIKSIGYGETRLKNNCTDNMECSEEEHQINRRTEIRVLKGGQVLISSSKSEFEVPKGDYTEGSLLADASANPAKFAQNMGYPLRYLVIVGTYAKSANAEKQRQKVVSAGFVETDLVLFKDNGFYGVCVRHFDNQKEAQALSNYINSQKEFEAFVKELK